MRPTFIIGKEILMFNNLVRTSRNHIGAFNNNIIYNIIAL